MMNAQPSSLQPQPQPMLQRLRPTLSQVLSPRSVAVIGAADHHGIGQVTLANLTGAGFAGAIATVDGAPRPGQHVKPTLMACGQPLDLVVAAVQAVDIPAVVADCIRCGVSGLVLLPAHDGAHEPDPRTSCREALHAAAEAGILVIGPDSCGIINPHRRLHAAYTTTMPVAGHLAIVGQSAGLVSALVEHACQAGIGLSGVVALGAMGGVGWVEVLEHFADDPHTRAIILCIEDLGDSAAFLAAAREVSATKPIVAIKASGDAAARRPGGEPSPFSGDEVVDALFARAGVLRIEGFGDLFAVADVLAAYPQTTGRRLAIVSSTRGVGMITAEATERGGGIVVHPAPAGHHVPATTPAEPGSAIHLVDRAGSGLAREAREALDDPRCDGVLVVLTTSGIAHPTQAAEALCGLHEHHPAKPLLASWMGGSTMEAGRKRLARAGIPVFAFPDVAARAWNGLGSHRDLVTGLYELARPEAEPENPPDQSAARLILDQALGEDRLVLNDEEVLRLLVAYRLPVAMPAIATTHDEAIAMAATNGYPVEVESWPAREAEVADGTTCRFLVDDDDSLRSAFHALRSATQSARGPAAFAGVRVRHADQAGGRHLTVSLACDAGLGPVIGIHEHGRAASRPGWTCGLPPFSAAHARQLMARAGIERMDDGAGGGSPLERFLLRFSRLAIGQPRLKAAELTVTLNRHDEPMVLSARLQLHERALTEGQLPHPAIRPYPAEYESEIELADGTRLSVRPIVATDEVALGLMHQGLSERTVHYRYFSDVSLAQRVKHARLARICHADYARQIALVVEHRIPGIGSELIAVGRLNRRRSGHHADLALLVADQWQRRSIGGRLMEILLGVARREGIRHVSADFLADNQAMRHLCQRHGFDLRHEAEGNVTVARLDL